MEDLKNKIGKGGLLLAALGIISALLYVFNYNVRLLAWIDMWGTTVGWVLRGLFIFGGGALFYFFGREEAED
ncbi:MAG: hypothetical protein R2776_04145 [Flavobacteriaceae bacterium]|nr:hypothetical protein [Flavobacteriaceae bacterium]